MLDAIAGSHTPREDHTIRPLPRQPHGPVAGGDETPLAPVDIAALPMFEEYR